MLNVGRIKEIWRYPVKGMAGERLESCALSEKGLKGDRTWALRDEARKEIQSCKFRPELLLCTARDRGASGQVDVTFPDGSLLGSDNAEIHSQLSKLTGHVSTLEPLRPDSDLDFYRRRKLDDHTWLDELKATFDREAGEPLPDFSQIPPPLVDFVSIPGTFFLVTPLHVVTTATLAHLKGKNPRADWDVRRFRPNFLIETSSGTEGFLEQDWVGKRLTIGDAAIDCAGATPRCGAVTRAQPAFDADKSILRTVVKDADQNVGVYAVIANPGNIRVGDPVYLA
jgi:uncharacterized protein